MSKAKKKKSMGMKALKNATYEGQLYPYPYSDTKQLIGGIAFSEGVSVPLAYKAIKQNNGNYTIKHLDVFESCTRTKDGQELNFSDTWIDAAIKTIEDRKKRGYYPPAHVDHHDKSGASRQFAGYMDNLTKEGDTVFADVVEIPPTVFKEIVNKRLPFRSVEVLNYSKPDFSSLAMTATVVPFHKFPITVVDYDGPTDFTHDKGGVFFAEDTKGSIVISQKFANGEYDESMTDDLDYGEYNEEEGGLSIEDLLELLSEVGGEGGEEDLLGGLTEEDLLNDEELQGEEDNMGDILNALQSLAQNQAELSNKVDAMVNGNEETQISPPAAIYSSQPKDGDINFSTADAASIVTAIKMLATQVEELTKFKEDTEAQIAFSQWSEGVTEEIGKHLTNLNVSDKQAEILYGQACNFAQAELGRGNEKPDFASYFANTASLFSGPDNAPPPADKTYTGVQEGAEVSFCESDNDIKVIFSESGLEITDERARVAIEASKEFDEAGLQGMGLSKKWFINQALTGK